MATYHVFFLIFHIAYQSQQILGRSSNTARRRGHDRALPPNGSQSNTSLNNTKLGSSTVVHSSTNSVPPGGLGGHGEPKRRVSDVNRNHALSPSKRIGNKK
jgi:hypothetical protein